MTQLYGLWEKHHDDDKWYRMVPSLAYDRSTAIRRFQSALLDAACGYAACKRELRPVGHVLNSAYLRDRAHLNTLKNDF